MKDVEKVGVSDLGLASLLATLQFQMIGLERVNEKRVNFLFARTEGIEEVINNFWSGAEVSVPVQSLFFNQKTLKSRLFALK